MRTKIRALNAFTVQNRDNNCIWLLKEIKGVTHQFDTKRNIVLTLHDARVAYYNCKQTTNQSNAEYLDLFRSNIDVLKYYKVTVGESYLFVDDLSGSRTELERAKIARGCTIETAFLKGADPRRYSALWSDLANQKTRGNDQYPPDLTAAYSLLVNYCAPSQTPNHNQRQHTNQTLKSFTPTSTVLVSPGDIGAHTLAQAVCTTPSTTPKLTAGTDGILHNTVTCFTCNSGGHYASHCPVETVTLVQN
jgi:hypothetical protein